MIYGSEDHIVWCSRDNGITWKNYTEVELPSGLYKSLDYKNNLVVAVGQFNANQAVISIGRR